MCFDDHKNLVILIDGEMRRNDIKMWDKVMWVMWGDNCSEEKICKVFINTPFVNMSK